ncbi:MAG: dUTP diphosphatase [Candidatus Nanopelagicaceae bacterium]
MNHIEVQIKRLDKDLPIPQYAKSGDAGVDIYARIDCTLAPGQRAMVPTGIAIALPDGYVCFAHPRSGLAAKHGISIVNAPGTIDAGYRGEIQIILINTDTQHTFEIKRGDRIAQLVFQMVEHANFHEVEELPDSERGRDGFGSTGSK